MPGPADNQPSAPPGGDTRGHVTILDSFRTLAGLHPYRKVNSSDICDEDDIKASNPKTFLSRIFTTSVAYNRGVYDCAISDEKSARYAFRASSILIDVLYLVQIVVAASFTGLSAYSDHRTTLTVLGAINTVLAAFMAWLKGQGMPNRFLKAREQYADVIRSIEDVERLYAVYDKVPEPERGEIADVFVQAKRLQGMYKAAKQTESDNHPDVYASNQAKPGDTANAKPGEDSLQDVRILSGRNALPQGRHESGATSQPGP
ncbi:hypothetical protein LTR85_011722 [Meristemomyces frigidus]|nr:hypothetical protein LTR85_011722 [Meristemomyces frigidus]